MATLPNETMNQASNAFRVIPSDTINIPQPYVSASGTNNSVLPNSLEDTTADFLGVGTTIQQVLNGDTVYNETSGLVATVTKVDNTILELSADIFLATPADYTVYQGNPEPNSFLLYVGTTGDVSIQTSLDKSVILRNVANASFIPINVGRVNFTDTTAQDIIALL
jgi:hypothetical protein